jgi:ribosomal protein S18 acetylase RimI-like enzyme
MTDETSVSGTAAAKAAPALSTRAGTFADLDMVHRELLAVIDESPFYNDAFKAYEKRRLNKRYLRALLDADPWHIMVLTLDGNPAGAIVSGPEFGAIFRYWSWVFPRYRESKMGMHGMRAFDAHFDNGRFHKAFTLVRPENQVALLLLRRYGYKETCRLENHLFGQDYMLIEKPYTKVTDGYDSGVNFGRLADFRRLAKQLVRRAGP